jgi:hypothetical protein
MRIYTIDTSINGFRHVGDVTKTYVYRLAWLLVILLSIVYSAISIQNTINGKNSFLIIKPNLLLFL